jgi:hypothetical protein
MKMTKTTRPMAPAVVAKASRARVALAAVHATEAEYRRCLCEMGKLSAGAAAGSARTADCWARVTRVAGKAPCTSR